MTQIQKEKEQETEQLTEEKKLIDKLCLETKKQLIVLNEQVNKVESTKKEIIRNLAYNINDLGLCPTDMICDLIATKLKTIVPHTYITKALDSKYKNQNYKGRSKTSSAADADVYHQESSSVIIDYGQSFDVRDCLIELWHTYSDQIKKAWVIKLIDDKRQLQKEVIELQARLPSS